MQKRQAGRLCLHGAAREKPTTFDEILGEEIGDDELDAAHIGPVDDSGDRLAQSVPRAVVGIRHCCDPERRRLGGRVVEQRACTHRQRMGRQLSKLCHRIGVLLLRLALFALAPFRVQRRPCMRRAMALTIGFTSDEVSERLLIYAVEAEDRVTRATSRQDHREQGENETWNLSVRTWKVKMRIEKRAYLFLFVMPLF